MFLNGRSLAIRIPKELRFEGKEVSIRRLGDGVLLEPVKAATWPPGYFESIRIDDEAFVRPDQGELPPVAEFPHPLHLLPFDWDSALKAAAIRWELEKIGRKIGPHDLRFAGQALALDVTLVSHNLKEFRRVGGLKVEDWEGA